MHSNHHHDEREKTRPGEADANVSMPSSMDFPGSPLPDPIRSDTLADDPRLTQYALGDVDDEAMSSADRAEIERLLAEHPELQTLVDDIRRTAGELESELRTESATAATLSADQRADVLAAAGGSLAAGPVVGDASDAEASPGTVTIAGWLRTNRTWLSAAAAVVVVGGTAFVLLPNLGRTRGGAEYAVDRPADGGPEDSFAFDPSVRENRVVPSGPPAEQSAGRESKRDPGQRADGLVAGDSVTLGRESFGQPLAEAQPGIEAGASIMSIAPSAAPAPRGGAALPPPGSDARLRARTATAERELSSEAVGEGRGETAESDDAFADVLHIESTDDAYAKVTHNDFESTAFDPISTFSVDVDTASYANVRRFLNDGQLPPPGAVRVEEFINAFDWEYAPPTVEPTGKEPPFATHVEVGPAPWNTKHRLVKIGLKGYEIPADNRPPVNLVFLIDVSGSMGAYNKLPLVQQSMRMLVESLGSDDRIAIVTYASGSRIVLDSTSSFQKEKILAAIDSLSAGGSTHASAGIHDAYKIAQTNFIEGGANRVILATDGDFNVGTTNTDELVTLMQEKAKGNVFVTVLGFGTGNYKDDRLEQIANKGNGNYAYIDSDTEAEKVLVDGLAGSLIAIAKDVKIQVVFNPEHVAGYRLIGYENRMLATEDFIDDRKDAGEIGVGHEVTALYEVVPAGGTIPAAASATSGADAGVEDADGAGVEAKSTDRSDEAPLLDEVEREAVRGLAADDLMLIKLRWKHPEGDTSTEARFTTPVSAITPILASTSSEFRFASAVALFGQILRGSPYVAGAGLSDVADLARAAQVETPASSSHAREQAEFIHLVYRAVDLAEADDSERWRGR